MSDYPSEEALKQIEEWPHDDLHGLFDLMRENWHFREWGWDELERDAVEGEALFGKGRYRVLHISTGGWSGNESLISALRRNLVAWSVTWVAARRGGHFVFEIPLKKEKA